MHVDNANAGPSLSIIPFHEISMITGTSKIKTVDLRLRHCVVKSARNNEDKAADVLGTIVSIYIKSLCTNVTAGKANKYIFQSDFSFP